MSDGETPSERMEETNDRRYAGPTILAFASVKVNKNLPPSMMELLDQAVVQWHIVG